MRKLGLVLLAYVFLFCFGCGKKEARISVAPGGAQVKVQTKEGSATITTGQGDISGLPQQLRYPGAVLIGTTDVQTSQGSGKTYVLETTDPKQTVVEFYKNAMPNWSNKITTETPAAVVINATDSAGSQGMTVGVTTEAGKTQATVVYWHNR